VRLKRGGQHDDRHRRSAAADPTVGRTAIIAPDGAPLSPDQAHNGAIPTRGDPALVKALARAHRWRRMLDAGEHGTARELTKAERVNETCISRALRLTLLAPGMAEAILDGRQPEGMTLPGLMKGVAVGGSRGWPSPGRQSKVDCR